MRSKLRNTDEKCADIVTSFLQKYFYSTHTTNYQYVNDKEQQTKGIDCLFTFNNEEYQCDEKAAIRYVNKHLQTFSLELSFINQGGHLHQGWLTDEHKTNNSFIFVWIDKAKNDILTSIDDIQNLEFALVKKNKIIEHLASLGWTIPKLIQKQDYIRNNADESLGNMYKHKCKFTYSHHLTEKPINILLPRQTYLDIADYHANIIT